jgi:hypothetical protein
LPLAHNFESSRRVLEAVGVEQRLVELLKIVQLGERWVADDRLDAAAQLGARLGRA